MKGFDEILLSPEGKKGVKAGCSVSILLALLLSVASTIRAFEESFSA